nr:hypothetical protein [Tanacetum cinerariifolium]
MALFHTTLSKRKHAILIFTTAKTPHFCTVASPPSTTDEDDTVTTAVTILKHHRSKSRWTEIRTLFPSGFTPSQFSQITLELRNNPHLALNLFNFTIRHNLCPHTTLSYATIIHTLARSRQKTQALTLIQSAILKFSELTVFENLVKTYRTCDSAPFVFDLVIEACVRSSRVDQAVQIVRMLRRRGVSPLIGTVNSLLTCVCKCNGSLYGYDVYNEMIGSCDEFGDKKGVKRIAANVHTYNILMRAFYKDGLIDKVEQVWEDMIAKNCLPNAYSYSILMAVYCDDGRIGEATRVWEEMKDTGLKCDVMGYNTMIGGFCEAGDVNKAEEFFKEMGLSGVESSCVTYERLISGYCKVKDVDSAMLLYKDMCRKGFAAVGFVVALLVELLCEKGMVTEGLKVSRVAMKNNVCMKGESYEVLIKGLCDEGRMEEGTKLQAEMVGRGFEPNSGIYGAFIDGYVKVGNTEMAAKLSSELLELK